MLWWTMRKLRSKESDQRKQVVVELAEKGNAKEASAIAAALNQEDDHDTKILMLAALADLRHKETLPAVLAKLDDSAHRVRTQAALALNSLVAEYTDEVVDRALFEKINEMAEWSHCDILPQVLANMGNADTAFKETAFETILKRFKYLATQSSGAYGGIGGCALALGMLADERAFESMLGGLRRCAQSQVVTILRGLVSGFGDERVFDALLSEESGIDFAHGFVLKQEILEGIEKYGWPHGVRFARKVLETTDSSMQVRQAKRAFEGIDTHGNRINGTSRSDSKLSAIRRGRAGLRGSSSGETGRGAPHPHYNV